MLCVVGSEEFVVRFRYNRNKDRLPVKTICEVVPVVRTVEERNYRKRILNDDAIVTGVARCNIRADQCEKAVGRKFAFERAVNKMNLSKEDRREIWEDLRAQTTLK